MFHDHTNEFWERVEECRREAESAPTAEDRAAWLCLADEWLKLAQITEAEAREAREDLHA